MQSNRERIRELTPNAIQSSLSTGRIIPPPAKNVNSHRKGRQAMTQKRKTATTLRQLNSDLAILDSALSELEERRTAIVHRIGSFSSSRSRPSGILQFPDALTVDTYTEGAHVWSAKSNSIHPKVSSLPKRSKKKPATVKSRSSRSTTVKSRGLS
jgi:hypothetical protein